MGIFATFVLLCALGLGCDALDSNTPLIKKIWGPGTHLEGPHWTTAEKALYFVDIQEQLVHRLDTVGNVTTRSTAYGPVTPVVTVKDNPGLILLCVRTELFLLRWDAVQSDMSMRLLSAIDLGLPDNRCNDGKVDAKGRMWVGTMGKEVKNEVDPDQGSLYVATEDNYLHPEVKVKPVSVSNGLAWDANNKFMFYIDTPTKSVDVFDFELETAAIRNRRSVFSFTKNNVTGLPDGMTIDSDGHLWVACFNGGKVIKIDPRSGKLLEQHTIPASKVTSVMWGGPDLSTLFVTTSKLGLTAPEMVKQPEAGSLFAIEGTGSKGRPENQFVFGEAGNY